VEVDDLTTHERPRTVLHTIETGGPGGAERMLIHLATGIGPDYRSEVALIRDRWLAATLRGRGVPVTILRYTSNRFAVTLRDLVKLIRTRNVALLHTHEFFMNTVGLMASWLTGVPLVATVHGRNHYTENARRRLTYRLLGMFAGRLVTVSEANKRFLVEQVGIPSKRIKVIANGVPVDASAPAATLSALRESLEIDPHHRVVAAVGSLYPVKGHKYLIDAMPSVLRRFPQTVFAIVGQGGLREELEAHAARLGIAGHLRFLGHREDVHELLSICDIFVLPSLSEGMPLALLEAMAAGLPAVATRVGGITEVLEDQETGLLVPAGDSAALADKITTLLGDAPLAKQLGEAARQVAASRFSLAGMTSAYQGVYSELIGSTRSRW
jgi:glycosyltransferase involved in cell wall biosynthesis